MMAMLYIQKAFRVSIRCSLGKTVQSDQRDVLYIPEPGLKLFVQYLCFFDQSVDIVILEGKKGTLTLEMFLNI